MLNSAVEIIVITVSLLKIALRLDNSNRIGMIKGIEFSCHFLGRNQRILIMNLNWKLFRFCFIYRRRLITNVFHVRIINLETIITINRPRLRNQTLPKHRNLMCLIKFYRLCLFRSLLFHFVSLKKKCFIVLLFPSKSAMAVAVCVCVCAFVCFAGIVRQTGRRARFAISGIWQHAGRDQWLSFHRRFVISTVTSRRHVTFL